MLPSVEPIISHITSFCVCLCAMLPLFFTFIFLFLTLTRLIFIVTLPLFHYSFLSLRFFFFLFLPGKLKLDHEFTFCTLLCTIIGVQIIKQGKYRIEWMEFKPNRAQRTRKIKMMMRKKATWIILWITCMLYAQTRHSYCF